MIIWKYKKKGFDAIKKQVTLSIGQIYNTNKYMPCDLLNHIFTYTLVNSKYIETHPTSKSHNAI